VIGGVILAAGGGRRFGAVKQLAELGGRPLLAYAIDAMAAVPAIDPILVVLGSDAGEVADGVDLRDAEPLVCAGWEEGMAAPLRAGVGELDARGAEAAIITLGDQPFITAQMIAGVIDHAGPDWQAVRASYAGRPGHPVLITRSLFPAVAALRGDVGARDLLATATVRHWECGRLGRDDDIDTPDQLEAARP
jgi:CTP:molybdopterin cytidylyltransferase MocA